jgi:serine/threonine protein kinase
MGSTQTEQQDGMPEVAGYRLLRILGHGGMSTVYLGQQLSLGREIAIKVMRQEVLTDEIGRRRFENEARTIARLDHPHIVHIHEVGRTREGQPYYVMPVFPRGHLGKRNLTRDESASAKSSRPCCRPSPMRMAVAWCIATSRPRTCCSTRPSGRC